MIRMILFSFLSLAGVVAQAELVCPNGDGSYAISYDGNDLSKVQFTIINASGVEDAQGTLRCDGPQESAFLCDGEVSELDAKTLKFTGKKKPIEVVISESTFQGGVGYIQMGGNFFRCSTK